MVNNYPICNEHVTPKNDIVFKKIFGSKGNEGILKDFLESILDIEIDSLTLDLGTELLPEFHDGKSSRVDVRTFLSDGTEINVELQVDTSDYSDERCLDYWSKIYSRALKIGKKYTNHRKTICIWILDGNVFEGFSDYHSTWGILELKHLIRDRFKDLEFHMIELPKFRKDDTIKPNRKNFWLWFIDHNNKEMLKLAYIDNEKVREAREQLDKISSDPELMERIRLEEQYEMDVATKLARAENKGIEKSKKEIALNLLKLNLPIEQISQATGLSSDEIEKLKVKIEE